MTDEQLLWFFATWAMFALGFFIGNRYAKRHPERRPYSLPSHELSVIPHGEAGAVTLPPVTLTGEIVEPEDMETITLPNNETLIVKWVPLSREVRRDAVIGYLTKYLAVKPKAREQQLQEFLPKDNRTFNVRFTGVLSADDEDATDDRSRLQRVMDKQFDYYRELLAYTTPLNEVIDDINRSNLPDEQKAVLTERVKQSFAREIRGRG